MSKPNPFLLAADDPDAVLPLLQADPSLASTQDPHGYSLVHAAASYNHLALLRALVRDHGAPVDLRDEDGETALFVVETVEAARALVDELGADPAATNDAGQTAEQKIEEEGDWPAVAAYLRGIDSHGLLGGAANGAADAHGVVTTTGGTVLEDDEPVTVNVPPVPEGLTVTMGTMDAGADVPESPAEPELRRRIEELAARPDFQTAEGQAELRKLVEDAIAGEGLGEERNVRARQD